MGTRYKSIGMKESDYLALFEKKGEAERILAKRLDWGDFLMLLANLKPVSQIVGYPVAGLHDSEGKPLSNNEMAEANVEEFPGLPVTLTEEDQERIAELVASKLAQRSKGG